VLRYEEFLRPEHEFLTEKLPIRYDITGTIKDLQTAVYPIEHANGIREFLQVLRWWATELDETPMAVMIFTDVEMERIKQLMTLEKRPTWRYIGRTLLRRSKDSELNWNRFVAKRAQEPWTGEEDHKILKTGDTVYRLIPDKSPEAIPARMQELTQTGQDCTSMPAGELEQGDPQICNQFAELEEACFRCGNVQPFQENPGFLENMQKQIEAKHNRTNVETGHLYRAIRWWQNETLPFSSSSITDFTKQELAHLFDVVDKSGDWHWLRIGRALERRAEECRLVWISLTERLGNQLFTADDTRKPLVDFQTILGLFDETTGLDDDVDCDLGYEQHRKRAINDTRDLLYHFEKHIAKDELDEVVFTRIGLGTVFDEQRIHI
jgi:hypothetical protein